jgi:hypothetical protein|tara:strand:- start:1126 stop:1464 length:339 start_codon:yes stop_codon:yes gene_type:complete
MITLTHPTISGYNLNLEGLLAPENSVLLRGRVTSKNEIKLPDYWEELVEARTISVHLTPIGAHQNVIVKRIGSNTVYLQAQGGMPIDCYYFIMGERKDVPRLKAEQRVDTED